MTGRLKDLIILQGRNFYPQDIESTAQLSHSALNPTGCAAFSSDIDGEERLIVVAEISPREKDHQGIIEAVQRAIWEEYGILVHAVALLPPKAIPKTSSGKLQRHACRRGFMAGEMPVLTVSSIKDGAVHKASYVAPRTELERRLARIWEQTLAVERVGIEDDFFQMGGHSLLATQALAQINDALGLELPIRQLFDAPTVAKLAEVITSSGAGLGKNDIPRIKRLVRPAAVSRK